MYDINKRCEERERTHHSRPANHLATNPPLGLEEKLRDGDPEIEAADWL
jgi:hypothetical protein